MTESLLTFRDDPIEPPFTAEQRRRAYDLTLRLFATASVPELAVLPAREIEVTPEMIAAGRREIAAVWLDFVSDHGGDMWPEVLTAVFRAMVSVSCAASKAEGSAELE